MENKSQKEYIRRLYIIYNYGLLLNLIEKINLKGDYKYVALTNLCTGKYIV